MTGVQPMATNPRAPRAVQVPGEPTAEAQTPIETVEPVVEAAADEPVADEVGEPNAPAEVNDEVAQLRAQLEAERIARIEAEQRAAQAQATIGGADRVVHVEPATPVTALKPSQSAKLSEHGWVVPATYGSPAKAA
jgi:hypothetical protein